MRQITYLFILLCVATVGLFAKEYERVLTEKSSVQTALAINPDVLEYVQNLEYAKERLKEAHALYFPTVGFNLNISKFNNAKPGLISGENSQTLIYLPSGKKDLYWSTQLSVWQSLYTGGVIRTTNKLAHINLSKVKSDENIIKSRVTNNIKTIFNECLYHKALVKFYDEKFKISNNPSLKTKKEMEILKYNQEVLELLNAIGLDLNTIVAISDNLEPKIKKADLEKCLLIAYQYKSEFKSTQEQQTLDGLMLNMLYMQKAPNISVGVAHQWTGDQIVGDDTNSYCTLNLNVPIFDGGSIFARIKQGKIKYRKSTLKRAKLESDIRLEIMQAFLEYDFFRQQAINSKLLDKNSKYNEADIELIYNLNKNYLNLELAVGVELDSY
ncbi:MAG: TolC family protein [Endomicrobium sp.]|jgi:hypothetical protein|nr:TolC family protein [Endomicrobium sp.]